jgi:hypothetical protein
MVSIKTFDNPFDAEVAARTLEAHGIEARLSSDGAASMIPYGFGGVQLFVHNPDVERAVEILSTPEPGGVRRVDQVVSGKRARSPRSRIISGLLWMIGGIGVTVGTYVLSAPTGTFVVAWGAMLYGLYEIGRGIVEARSSADTVETHPRRDDNAS